MIMKKLFLVAAITLSFNAQAAGEFYMCGIQKMFTSASATYRAANWDRSKAEADLFLKEQDMKTLGKYGPYFEKQFVYILDYIYNIEPSDLKSSKTRDMISQIMFDICMLDLNRKDL